MNVVIVDGDVSYPATSGKRLRTLNLMLQLAKRHRITYIGRCAADSEEARVAPEYLRDHRIEPILVPHPVPKKSGLVFYGRLFANLFSAWQYSLMSHQSKPMRQVISQVARDTDVDVWQLEWSPYFATLDRSIKGPRIIVAHNVESLIWQRYYETETNVPRKVFLDGQWRKFRRYEEFAFQQATRVVAVSGNDASLIRDQFGQPNVDTVENGVDCAFYQPLNESRDPFSILFIGALDWRPNLDAVDLLLTSIFPNVHAADPSARLLIVGRNPSAALRERLSKTPSVELHANVADVRPYLGKCGVMVVPLRIGGGSRLKILESLACGLPVVSTKIGAEGLTLN